MSIHAGTASAAAEGSSNASMREAPAIVSGPICVTGASGFIGRHLLAHPSLAGNEPLRCLVRDPAHLPRHPQLAVTDGDLRDAAALARLVVPRATVFNLAFDRTATLRQCIEAAVALAHACETCGAKRLIHLSTATVVGDNADPVIDERSPCLPVTPYERAKLAVEETLARHLSATELVVLRPTAVFGPGGLNVVKLAAEIAGGNRAARYAKACFHGHRPLNLVSVENVIAALVFLANVQPPVESMFIVTDAEEPSNNYLDVERILAGAFGRTDHSLPVLCMPAAWRELLLRAWKPAAAHSYRRYSPDRLRALGHTRPAPFEATLAAYAEYLAAQFRREGEVIG